MRHIELHIIQSVPVSCLNRDDFGSPKTATFGSAERARISSQCWKRSIREAMRELCPELCAGQRTRLIIEPLQQALMQMELDEESARRGAEDIAGAISKLDTPPTQVKTLLFTTPMEIHALARNFVDSGHDAKKAVKSLSKTLCKDGADIALYGRMVTSDPSLSVEGAAMFSHALSTHRVDNDIDFFSAVDDLQNQKDSGAGMVGTIGFTSATFYRFVGLNLDLFSAHMSVLSVEERQQIVRAFISSALTAMPKARKNSMHATTLPSYVLAIIRESGHPIQLVNAFEAPVYGGGNGLIDASIDLLEKYYVHMRDMWGLTAAQEMRLPESSLPTLLDGVSAYVR